MMLTDMPPCLPGRSSPPQFAKLRHQGCSFLVAGRCDEEGRFRTLADLEMPDMLPRGVSGGQPRAGSPGWFARLHCCAMSPPAALPCHAPAWLHDRCLVWVPAAGSV